MVSSSSCCNEKSIREVANSLVFTVILFPILTRVNFNEEIKTHNVCIDGISLVIAVDGIKELHKSISKCYAPSADLPFFLYCSQTNRCDH